MVLTRSSMNNNGLTESIAFDALPAEILENVLGYLPYATVGRMRLISRKMSFVCGDFLSHSFQRVQKVIAVQFSALKAGMPRRDSLRRNHPLSNELEIMDMLQARLSLLQLGMGKHLAQNHCYFFAGEVLDECVRILRYVHGGGKEKPYKVTEELFDLTSMALDFFKEHIEPYLPEISSLTPADTYYKKMEDSMASASNALGESAGTSDATAIDSHLRSVLKHVSKSLKRKSKEVNDMARKQKAVLLKVTDHEEQILNLARRLDESEKSSADCSVKLAIVKQEIDKCKAAIQVYHSRFPTLPEACHTLENSPPDENKIALKSGLQEQ